MKRTICFLSFCFILATSYSQHQLVLKWETDSLFKVPESVVYDGVNDVLYVSNIDGTDPWGKDGKGSIGKLGVDGKIINAEWVSGLNAPKGLGIYNGKLYAADLNNVVVIEIATGEIAELITIETAQGLNDITIDRNGVVYVSDSKAKKVFKIEGGRVYTILENLKGPNGVLMVGNVLYLLDAGSMYRIGDDKRLNLIADGMEGGTDGIENIKDNDFIISCWAGVIWYINGDGTKQLLLDTRPIGKNTADIGYDGKTRTIFVPTFFKNSVIAYEVK